ncbi:cell division protein SepF [Natronorarus salvus]|uniref:cell division protein SepF n=1 Tax=Natronorarus salvus TaxID=3117733 RepID=UPI002F2680BA
MGFMDKLLGEQGGRGRAQPADEYVEVGVDDIDPAASEEAMRVHIADINDQQDLIEIKDAVYDGDMVIADIVRLRTSDRATEHIIDELRQVANEVDGDIVQKGDDQIIIAPTGVRIGREKLGRR